ncbi:MAG: alpha/beta hydrolase [Tatlockia sp.]|jgi:pimeloyl-ACP methyl ester carboxylesterase
MKQNFVLCASEEGFHRMAYTEWGEPKLPSSAVICVHGLMRNSRDFDALAQYLSQHGDHVFCPDVVGRGDSSWLSNPQHYNFKRYVVDMNILISRTDAPEIDWIGTSMGGLIGIMLASLENSPIRTLILNDVSPQVPVHALWQMAKSIGRDPPFPTLEKAKAHYKKIYAEFGLSTEEQWDTFTQISVSKLSNGTFISKFDPSIHEYSFKWQSVKEMFYSPHKALEGVFFDIDLWQLWHNVHCPVLVIRGEHSTLLLPEHIEKMRKTHPDVEVYEVAGAGHAPALLELEEQEKIRTWLASHI